MQDRQLGDMRFNYIPHVRGDSAVPLERMEGEFLFAVCALRLETKTLGGRPGSEGKS